MLGVAFTEKGLPELVVIEDRIELSTQRNLRVRGKLLPHNRLHISCHVDGRPAHDLPSASPLKTRLCPRKIEIASDDRGRVHFRRSVQLGDVGSRDQIHILVHLLRVTQQQQTNAQVIQVQRVVTRERGDALAEIVAVHGGNAHVDVLVAEVVVVRLQTHRPLVCQRLVVVHAETTLTIQLTREKDSSVLPRAPCNCPSPRKQIGRPRC